MKKLFLLLFSAAIVVTSNAQIGDLLKKATGKTSNGKSNLSTDEIASGLKEALNKGVSEGTTKLSTVDGFFVPALPDLFSLYGIKNIGKSLASWKEEFDTIYKLISNEKRHVFPEKFVRFLGYTIYNAKKYTGTETKWNLARAHLNYAEKIPQTIHDNISASLRDNIPEELLELPIGSTAIMHTHNTFPSMAQYYNVPMWLVPDLQHIESEHVDTLRGARKKYIATQDGYHKFTEELLERIKLLG